LVPILADRDRIPQLQGDGVLELGDAQALRDAPCLTLSDVLEPARMPESEEEMVQSIESFLASLK
jgi:hypothetical protein